MPHPIAISSIRILPDRSFQWKGKPSFDTNLTYTVNVYQFKPSKDDRAQHSFLKYTSHETIETIKQCFPSYFNQIRLRDSGLNKVNDRVWLILLKFPPTHRIEVTAQFSKRRRVRGDMSIVRPIFAASLNLQGFSRNAAYTSRLVGGVLASIVRSSTSNYLLVNSIENDEFYYQAILACGRYLILGSPSNA